MAKIDYGYLASLVQARGEDYWRAELKKAQQAVIVYGIALVVAFVLRFAMADSVAGIALPWLIMAGATLYAGASQMNLLPFMGSNPTAHWIAVAVLALLGCGGILWLALFAHYNKQAANNLDAALRAASQAPPVSPYPRG